MLKLINAEVLCLWGFDNPKRGYREDTYTMIFEVSTSKNGLLQILSDI